MKDFDALVDIWKEQKTAPLADHKQIIEQYKRGRRKLTSKLFAEILVMMLALAGIAYILLSTDFDLWTSYLGIVLIALCCLYFIIMQLVNINNISNSNTLFDQPKDHIKFLKRFRKSRHTQHSRNYRIYVLLVGLGTTLFTIEYFLKLPTTFMVIAVAIIAIWFSVYYFYFLKLYIKKEDEKLDQMILDLERLNIQFTDQKETLEM